MTCLMKHFRRVTNCYANHFHIDSFTMEILKFLLFPFLIHHYFAMAFFVVIIIILTLVDIIISREIFNIQEVIFIARKMLARDYTMMAMQMTTTPSHCTPNEAFYMQSGRPISIWYTALHLRSHKISIRFQSIATTKKRTLELEMECSIHYS